MRHANEILPQRRGNGESEVSRSKRILALTGALLVLVPGVASALTREIAELQPARLTFERSVLNQLTFGTYRTPYDELQTRPYNLLFTNIGRHANLSPWQDQQGNYSRYLNAMIGNNGAVNVDNDADSIQGAWVQRQTDSISWGLSAAFLAGNDRSDATNGIVSLESADDLTGFDLRGSTGFQISERRVLGAGIRLTQASSEVSARSFEPGLGGQSGSSERDQLGVTLDFGVRSFLTPRSSWEARIFTGFGSFQRDLVSENIDDTGAVTDRFVSTNYDINDLNLGIVGSYNRLRLEGLGETQFQAGIDLSQRELNNTDLAYNAIGGIVTPTLTLLDQDPVRSTRFHASARTVFQAGHTELFAGGELGYSMTDGSTRIENDQGTITNETIDDSGIFLGLILGLRQPLYEEKLRFIVSARGDLISQERGTSFDFASGMADVSQTNLQYAIGLEGVLANVTFDLAWLSSLEAPVTPVPLGFTDGSRKVVELDRLVVSAAVSW